MAGEKVDTVVDRMLAFDELSTLKKINTGLKQMMSCKVMDVVAIDKGEERRWWCWERSERARRERNYHMLLRLSL